MMTNEEMVVALRVISKLFASDEISGALNIAAYTLEMQETILKEEYQRGLNDAWNAARDIELSVDDGGLSIQEIEHIFGDMSPNSIIKNFNPEYIVNKLNEYNDRKPIEINVGDEVANSITEAVMIVIRKCSDEKYVDVMYKDGSVTKGYPISELKKTGRHFSEIANALDKMYKFCEIN